MLLFFSTCLFINIFYHLSLWGLHCVCVEQTEGRGAISLFLVLSGVCDMGDLIMFTHCERSPKFLCTQFPVLPSFQCDYSATWRFHCNPVVVWWTGMVRSSYIVKHLLKPPLRGVCVSAFACVWHLHGHYCSPSIWMGPTAHWSFTTSYEKAQWLDICLCSSAGQRDKPRGQRGPQVDFRQREQQLA